MSRRAFACIALLSVIACLIGLPTVRAGELSHARIVRLSYVQGDVQSSAGSSRWQKAIVNTPLREGMSLATGEGRAEVELEMGAGAWMASHTVLEFPQLALDEGAKLTQLAVRQGTASFDVNPGRHDSFAVQAGQLLIVAPDTARFRVDVFDDGASVSVQHGEVDVTAHGVTQHVSNRKTLALRNDSPTSSAGAVVNPSPRSDAWDRWVSDRNNAVEAARLNTRDNLSAPVGYGMADLSFYGGWLDVPGYGLAWQPYGVGAGWAPFYNGFWDSFGDFGLAWISYEPWGWLPYHYGGWLFSPLYGWVWAPGAFGLWSPGTVAWVRSPIGTGWVPLAPRETVAGTPVNLTHAVITNTPAGMLGRSRNEIVRGQATAGFSPVGNWTNNAELVRFSQQVQAGARPSASSLPSSVHFAQRMPEGPAPRIATAGMLAGRVPTYRPPSSASSARFGYHTGPASYGGSTASSSIAPAGTHSAGSASHGGGAGGGGGSHGKP
jgi:hypothetical protein